MLNWETNIQDTDFCIHATNTNKSLCISNATYEFPLNDIDIRDECIVLMLRDPNKLNDVLTQIHGINGNLLQKNTFTITMQGREMGAEYIPDIRVDISFAGNNSQPMLLGMLNRLCQSGFLPNEFSVNGALLKDKLESENHEPPGFRRW